MEASRLRRAFGRRNQEILRYVADNRKDIQDDVRRALVVDGHRDPFTFLPVHGLFLSEVVLALALLRRREARNAFSLEAFRRDILLGV